MLPRSARESDTGIQTQCLASPIILDTGSPRKCSRSRKYFRSGLVAGLVLGISRATLDRFQGWYASRFDESRPSGDNRQVASLQRVGLWRSLGARFHGMEEVVGSIPTRSTKSIKNIDRASVQRQSVCVMTRHFASIGDRKNTR